MRTTRMQWELEESQHKIFRTSRLPREKDCMTKAKELEVLG